MPQSVIQPPARSRARKRVGNSETKVDIEDKVTGRAKYGSDLQSDDYLYAAVVRSSQSHARILSVDVETAAAVDGVQSVVTRDELLGQYDDRVRFYGDVIAAVAAEDADTAEKAANLVDADLEPLDTVYDPREAISPDAPKLHPNNPDFGQHGRHEFDNDNEEFVQNVDDYHSLTVGDVEAGFEEADIVYEDEYVTPRVSPCNLDTHCCVAEWDGDQLIIEETLGAPGRSKDELAEFMGMDGDDVEIPLTAAQKHAVREHLGPRITASGELLLEATEHRSQTRNREAVIARFRSLLREALAPPPPPRRPTRPSRGAKERRLQHKRERSERKRLRRPPTEG